MQGRVTLTLNYMHILLELRKRPQSTTSQAPIVPADDKHSSGCLSGIPGPKGPWMYYCFILICWIPSILLNSCGTCLRQSFTSFSLRSYVVESPIAGIRSPEQQRAWREKMGLLSIILQHMAGVGFLTFGFTEAVCGTPLNRYYAGQIENSSVIIHGLDYDFSNFKHPAGRTFNRQTNPLIQGGWNIAANDASFLFQKVNQNCLGLIQKAKNSSITGNGDNLDWYFPCNVHNQSGGIGANLTGYGSNTNCHTSSTAKSQFSNLKPLGQVYYTWDDIRSSSRNLSVFES